MAAYAEVLRDSRWARGLAIEDVQAEAELFLREIADPDVDELVELIDRAIRLGA